MLLASTSPNGPVVIPSLRATAAGLPQDAPKNGKHRTVGPPKAQLANLFAGQDNRRAKFSMGALKVGHEFVPLGCQLCCEVRLTQ
jgi:hypothetical protein